MRDKFYQVVNRILDKDKKTALILAGIGVAGFKESIDKYPDRVFNAGILEQACVSVSAGLSIGGLTPIFHTIAPFLVERSYEQLKIDFGYQNISGNFISNGASFDYSFFGATHQCPADINVLKQIPNMQIVVPGTANEFETLFLSSYNNGSPTYYRLSRESNSIENNVAFGKACIVKKGKLATIIAVGPMLERVLRVVGDIDATIIYYTTIEPFDKETLQTNCDSGKLLICEPYYESGILTDCLEALKHRKIAIDVFGYPRVFCTHYGYTVDNLKYWKRTDDDLRESIELLLRSN